MTVQSVSTGPGRAVTLWGAKLRAVNLRGLSLWAVSLLWCLALVPTTALAAPRLGLVELGDVDASLRSDLVAGVQASAGQVEVVSAADMTQHLERAASFGIPCADRAPACLVRVAALVGIRYVLRFDWQVGPDDLATFTATLVDVEGAAPFPQLKVTVPAGGKARLESFAVVLGHLINKTPLTGAVAITLEPGDALLIDGESAGRAQLERLSPGEHVVEIRSAKGTRRGRVHVLPGVATPASLPPVSPAATSAAPTDEDTEAEPGTQPEGTASTGGQQTPTARSPDEQLPDEPAPGPSPGPAYDDSPSSSGVGSGRVSSSDEGGLALLPLSLMGGGVALGAVGVAAGAGLWAAASFTVPTEDGYRQEKGLAAGDNFSGAEVSEYEQRVLVGQVLAVVGTTVLVVGALAAGGLLAAGTASLAVE